MEYSEQHVLQKTRRKTFSQIGLACFVILAVTLILELAAKYLTAYFAPEWAAQPWYLWVITFVPYMSSGYPSGFCFSDEFPRTERGREN